MSTETSKSWGSLPPEIRNMIVRLLPELGGRCSLLAPVCREWQAIIEPRNFADISMTATRLAEPYSQAILYQKRSLIRYIWFRVELKPYDCGQCTNTYRDDWGLDDADNRNIMDAFQNLLGVLHRWEPRGDLVLDISVHSPSDNQHWFKYLDFRPDTLQVGSNQKTALADDAVHGWVAGQQIRAPGEHAIEKHFGEIMGEGPFDDEAQEMAWWQSLPSVPVVGELLLRQQTRRRWKPVALANMLTRFPNVKELCWEPWREFTEIQFDTDANLETLMGSLPSTSLRRLTIFENFNEAYPKRYLDITGTSSIRVPDPSVGQKLARASLHLDTLSASFMIDARDFFPACQSSWKWEKLVSLTLTSRVLTNDSSASDIDRMLRDAAATALQMPKLERMELWNGKRGVAVLFRYQRARDRHLPAILTLRGTSDLFLGNEATQVWTAVARSHGNSSIVVQKSLVVEKIGSHADAISHLGLLTQVARPVSLQQIITEHVSRQWAHHHHEAHHHDLEENNFTM